MAKWYGQIGFSRSEEDPNAPGVWTENIFERNYFGDMEQTSRRLIAAGNVNDSVTVSNILSILMDPFAIDNFENIRYVTFMNSKWKVEVATVVYPRLKLTLGGLYNA